jgi:hypothetical protein
LFIVTPNYLVCFYQLQGVKSIASISSPVDSVSFIDSIKRSKMLNDILLSPFFFFEWNEQMVCLSQSNHKMYDTGQCYFLLFSWGTRCMCQCLDSIHDGRLLAVFSNHHAVLNKLLLILIFLFLKYIGILSIYSIDFFHTWFHRMLSFWHISSIYLIFTLKWSEESITYWHLTLLKTFLKLKIYHAFQLLETKMNKNKIMLLTNVINSGLEK